MSREDGGPAFPVADYDHMIFQPSTVAETKRDLSGMSLRDYFAAKAMQAMIANNWPITGADGLRTSVVAFRMADDMLAARSA
ncbi:hypothetical protein J3P89_19445 [Pseudomonas sp. Z1-14]|uniref:hypothetical protein n=1 Tax=Pseudomonas sp. Z1-14 TaxID=2817409 RepID=UPI003DA7ADFE